MKWKIIKWKTESWFNDQLGLRRAYMTWIEEVTDIRLRFLYSLYEAVVYRLSTAWSYFTSVNATMAFMGHDLFQITTCSLSSITQALYIYRFTQSVCRDLQVLMFMIFTLWLYDCKSRHVSWPSIKDRSHISNLKLRRSQNIFIRTQFVQPFIGQWGFLKGVRQDTWSHATTVILSRDSWSKPCIWSFIVLCFKPGQ